MSELFALAGPVLLPGLILLSLATALVIFPMAEGRVRLRSTVNIVAAVAKVVLIGLLVPVVVTEGLRPEFAVPFLPGVDLVLRADPLALFVAGLSAVLWLLTTIYAIGYLEDRPHRSRFFGFFSLCVMATVGIAFAGNLVTFWCSTNSSPWSPIRWWRTGAPRSRCGRPAPTCATR